MEDWSAKSNDKLAEIQQQNISAKCYMDGHADKFFKSLSSDAGKQSNQSLGLPDLNIENAMNYKPAEKGSKAFADWEAKAQERSNAALDPNCKNETTVQKGDSLWGVAERSMKEKGGDFSKKDVLAEMNKIIAANKDHYPWIEKNPNFLKEGMQLKLPEGHKTAPEASKGRSSSNAAEELSNIKRGSKAGSTEPKVGSSSNAGEEMSRLRNASEKANARGRSSSTAAEELSAFSRKSAANDGKQLGTASSASVEESRRNSEDRNSGENYNLSNFGDLESSKSNTITSQQRGSYAHLNFDAEGNSVTTGNTKPRNIRR